LLLRDGNDDSQGKNQIISNINACNAVAEILKTTLGPCGMDKMIETNKGNTISNDGATIINLLDITHPACRILVDISKAQDEEVGDGTTSVVIYASELLLTAKRFIEEGMNPQFIIKCFKMANAFIVEELHKLSVSFAEDNKEKRNMLLKCAETSLNSKLLSHYKEFFAEMIVSAVEKLDLQIQDKNLIGIKEVIGGSVTDSILIDGVAFKKTFSYAGFEQQPKKFENPKILLLNIELELKAERANAEIRIENPEEFQNIVDAEWKIIYTKLEQIVDSGAQIVLSKLPIGDLATQYFADRNVFCSGRVAKEDMDRVVKATGGKVQSTTSDLKPEMLGTCGNFEEKVFGAERFNIFKDCPKSKTATIILRGGAEQFIKEAERSLNDSIMIVRRVIKTKNIVPGGGAVEMELSKLLKKYSQELKGKEHLVLHAIAKALEIIPRTLLQNAGFDVNETLNKLRRIHSNDENGKNFGVNVNDEENSVCNTYESFVWEPLLVKLNYLQSANEAACLILSIDETIKAPQNEENNKMRKQVLPGRPGGGMQLK
jgi:T-complex protein 1 subunit eta